MTALFDVTDRSLLIDLLNGGGSFLPPEAILDGLTEEQALAKPHGVPHSIAEIVAHMAYWQEWFNACAETGFTAVPEQAALGWPEVSGGWEAVRGRLLGATTAAKRISVEASLSTPLLPPGVENPVLARDTHGSGLLHAAFHTAHHMGQIVTIRQLLGAWPPPAGSYTW